MNIVFIQYSQPISITFNDLFAFQRVYPFIYIFSSFLYIGINSCLYYKKKLAVHLFSNLIVTLETAASELSSQSS